MRGAPSTARRSAAALLGALSFVAGMSAYGGELEKLSVTRKGDVYEVRVRMRLDAPASEVFRVLTDYAHVYRLNPSITESLILPPAEDGSIRVRTHVEDCIAFICLGFTRVERLRETGPGELHAEIEPDSSDFRSGESHWKVMDRHGSALVTYEGRMTPGFSLPPLIGPAVMKRKLEEHILTTFARMECIARLRNRIAADKPVARGTNGGSGRCAG